MNNSSWLGNDLNELKREYGDEVIEHWARYGPASRLVCYVWGSVLLFISITGIVGNGIVLFVFTRFRRLRGPFSCFILNLATADFFTSVVHLMAVYSSFKGSWAFGVEGCRIYAMLVGEFGLVSIVTLSTIAVERYMVITAKPFSGTWKITQLGARKVCFVVWVYCLLMVVPPMLGWSSYVPEGFRTSCSWDYLTQTPLNRAYYIYLLTLGFLIPVSVITYCYVFILAAMISHSKEMKNVKSMGNATFGSLNGALSRGVAYYMNSTNTQRTNVVTWATSTIRTSEIILMLILLFLIAWSPYAIVTMLGQFGNPDLITPWVSAIPGLFAKASVIYNPIVYGLSHPHFRSSLRQYFDSCTHSQTVLASQACRHPSRRAVASPVPEHTRNANPRQQLSSDGRERETSGLTVIVTHRGRSNTLHLSCSGIGEIQRSVCHYDPACLTVQTAELESEKNHSVCGGHLNTPTCASCV